MKQDKSNHKYVLQQIKDSIWVRVFGPAGVDDVEAERDRLEATNIPVCQLRIYYEGIGD